jgi:hypothetical protein
MATVKCPACDRSVEVEDAYFDWTVQCPHCEAEFVPDDVARASARRRPRDDDFDDEPSGGASGAREEALQLVSAPALWLEICGWLGVLGSVGIAALCLVLAVEIANNPPPNANQNDESELFVFLGCCAGVLGLPYNVALVISARKMRNLSSRGWALAAAILGVAAFSVVGCYGLIHTGIGVWALVTLEKPVVREAFGLRVRRRRRSRPDRD